jgi:hypothetical protein
VNEKGTYIQFNFDCSDRVHDYGISIRPNHPQAQQLSSRLHPSSSLKPQAFSFSEFTSLSYHPLQADKHRPHFHSTLAIARLLGLTSKDKMPNRQQSNPTHNLPQILSNNTQSHTNNQQQEETQTIPSG